MMNHFILPTIYLLIPFGIAALFVGFVETTGILIAEWKSLRSKINIDFEMVMIKSLIYLVWGIAVLTLIVALYMLIF